MTTSPPQPDPLDETAERRSLGRWMILLAVWTVGLVVWAIYLVALTYLLSKVL